MIFARKSRPPSFPSLNTGNTDLLFIFKKFLLIENLQDSELPYSLHPNPLIINTFATFVTTHTYTH